MKKSIIFLTLIMAMISGCKDTKPWTYACVTPVGDIQINEATDTHVSLVAGIVRATRGSKSIKIPFSQCVALRNNDDVQPQ